jgi:hypothetical protein
VPFAFKASLQVRTFISHTFPNTSHPSHFSHFPHFAYYFTPASILTRSGEVKRQTSQAVIINANSPRFTFTNSDNDFVESLIFLMLQYPYRGDSSVDPNRQIFTDNRYPNTLAISVLQEQPKVSYSTRERKKGGLVRRRRRRKPPSSFHSHNLVSFWFLVLNRRHSD